MPARVEFGHAGRQRLADPDLRPVLRQGVDLLHPLGPGVVVLAGQEDGELVPADAEHRAVGEDRADPRAGAADAGVALLVPVEVVHVLEVVHVADHDGEGLLYPAGDLLVDGLLPLAVGALVLHAGQGVHGGHPFRHGELAGILLLLPDLHVLVLQADDERFRAVFLHQRRPQAHVGGQFAGHQPVIQHEHAVPLDGGEDVFPRDPGVEQRQVLGMERLFAVLIGGLEPVVALLGEAEVVILPGRAELRIMPGLGVDEIEHEQVAVQGVEAQVGLPLLLRALRGHAVLDLGVHVADADDDVPVVAGAVGRLHADVGRDAVDHQAVIRDIDPVLPRDLGQQRLLVHRRGEALQILFIDIIGRVAPGLGEEVAALPLRLRLPALGPGAVLGVGVGL